MYKKLITLATISEFALTACGGGSDDSGTSQPNNPTNNQINNPQSISQTENLPDTNLKMQIAAYKVTTNGSGDPISIATTPSYHNHNRDGNNYNQIVINGKTIVFKETYGDLAEDEKFRHIDSLKIGANGEDIDSYIVNPMRTSRGTAYARYGMVENELDEQVEFFYQGKPTEISNIPKQGTATYKGYAFGFDMEEISKVFNLEEGAEVENGQWYGLSEFNVDFGNKLVKGKLNDWRGFGTLSNSPKEIAIEATIDGNIFVGTANQTGYAEGKFYGPDAQNLAGAFNDKQQKLQGVFGANKQ